MADAYTGVAASNFDQTAFDLRAWYSLRPELYFDAFASVNPSAQSFNGAAVTFTITTDLSAQTTALSESTDVSAIALSDSQVTVTLAEYGMTSVTTAKLRGSTFIPYDPIVANLVGFNAGLSLDTICADVLRAGTNVDYMNSSRAARNEIIPTDTLTGAKVSYELAKLRGAYVQPFNGYYLGVIHPDVAYDLKLDTGTGNWRDPHVYSDPNDLWTGEVGVFSGCRFIEVARDPLLVADAGSSTTLTDVYLNLFMGQEALAKAHSMLDGNGPYPSIVPGPVTDHLRRFIYMGWYWFGAYAIFRQSAIRRVETASSIGTNA